MQQPAVNLPPLARAGREGVVTELCGSLCTADGRHLDQGEAVGGAGADPREGEPYNGGAPGGDLPGARDHGLAASVTVARGGRTSRFRRGGWRCSSTAASGTGVRGTARCRRATRGSGGRRSRATGSATGRWTANCAAAAGGYSASGSMNCGARPKRGWWGDSGGNSLRRLEVSISPSSRRVPRVHEDRVSGHGPGDCSPRVRAPCGRGQKGRWPRGRPTSALSDVN